MTDMQVILKRYRCVDVHMEGKNEESSPPTETRQRIDSHDFFGLIQTHSPFLLNVIRQICHPILSYAEGIPIPLKVSEPHTSVVDGALLLLSETLIE